MKLASSSLMSVVLLGLLPVLFGCDSNDDFTGGSGLIETDETIVSAEYSGRILERFFDEGSRIAVGDTLAIIDPSNLELELASLRAGKDVIAAQMEAARLQTDKASLAFDFATNEQKRLSELLESGTATQQQFDRVELELDDARIARKSAAVQVKTMQAQLAQTEANIARLERRLKDCYPLASAAGTVTEKYVAPGELITAGKPLVRVSRLDTVWVKVYLTTGDFSEVKLGDKASVSTESGGGEFEGTVVWTSQEAEFTPKNVQTEQSRADLVYAAKVSIPNPDGTLKVGMPVFVTLGK
jgi:membrane fusion protein YbhG